MPKCYILIGVPGSGKSTWIAKQDIDPLTPTYIASTDNIIDEIAHDYHMTYDEAFKDLIKFAEKVMWAELAVAAEVGDTIYVDRTNMSEKSRKKFIDFLKPYGYIFEAVNFETPEGDEWDRRLASRPGKTIPKYVLESMEKNYEIPLMREGFRYITFIKNNGFIETRMIV